jgi:2-methylcitrate dehydratase PrpD
MGKHLHAGKSAQSGVMSAMLAEKGFTGASTIIEGEEGFLNTMVDPGIGCPTSDNLPVVTHLNMDYSNNIGNILEKSRYHILDVYFKKYPVCRHLHSAADATLEIFNQLNSERVNSDSISNITVKTYKIAADHDEYHPKTVEAVRQSLPFIIAIAILKGDLNLENIEINHDIISMAAKVDIKHDPEMDHVYPVKRPAKVLVATKNKTYSANVDLPKGEPENPFKKEDIVYKFQNLNPEIDIDILECIDDLESFKIRDFMDILSLAK